MVIANNHHYEKIKVIHNSDTIWFNILRWREINLYTNIINYFPDKESFVDSSNNPFKTAPHVNNILKRSDIETKITWN